MTRLACLLFSLALHGGLLFFLTAGTGEPPLGPDASPEVVRVETLPPEAEPAQTAPAASEPSPPEAAADTADQPPQAQGPPSAAPADPPGPISAAPAALPGVEVISPVKRNMNLPPPLHVGRGQIKTGKVTAMTLRRLAGYDFTLDEFCGHYEVASEPGRFVDVTRHPGDQGALVLHDSATGMVRTLRRFSKFIFTYGPGFYENEPVEGSVTFLARKDFERIADVDERSRLLWQAASPPAKIAVRLDVPVGKAPPPPPRNTAPPGLATP